MHPDAKDILLIWNSEESSSLYAVFFALTFISSKPLSLFYFKGFVTYV